MEAEREKVRRFEAEVAEPQATLGRPVKRRPGAVAADDYIDSLELMGMDFGLDRMHDLLAALGHPEREFDAIHVVGSNGKSSTVRFCEALLEAERVHTGAYLSPHITSFRERIRLRGDVIDAGCLRRRRLGRARHAACR